MKNLMIPCLDKGSNWALPNVSQKDYRFSHLPWSVVLCFKLFRDQIQAVLMMDLLTNLYTCRYGPVCI
jgi:hypothetical protein